MRILMTSLLLFFTNLVLADAATYYFRKDGGSATQCDGTHDAPMAKAKDSNDKDKIPDCAWNKTTLILKSQSNGSDTFAISDEIAGEFLMSMESLPAKGSKTDFSVFKNHLSYYIDKTVAGETCIIRRYIKGKGIFLIRVQYVGKE